MAVHSGLSIWLSRARAEELRHATLRSGPAPDLPVTPATIPVTLRFAFPDDAHAVARLAVLDSSDPPSPPLLVAEVGSELQAALSLADGRVIADPFSPTAAFVELLHARARQLDPGTPRHRFHLPRIAALRWRSAWR